MCVFVRACLCVCLCEEDDDCPIVGAAPFFLYDSKTLWFHYSTEGLGLSEAPVATSLRKFIAVCDGC